MPSDTQLQNGVYVLAEVPGYGIVQAAGVTVPADGVIGYATGCVFSHLDGGDDTAAYINEGTNTSADFNALTP